METEVIFDYASLSVDVTERMLSIRSNGRTIYTLIAGIEETQPTALLRVGERVSFYRLAQVGNIVVDDVNKMLTEVMKQVEGGLFYVFGTCNIRTRRTTNKRPCRAVMIGTMQIAFRDTQLVFNTLPTKTLGNVVLDDTGDTMPLYVQLTSLI